ncbi:unnamed protein product [Symbiodinium sp. CCMP2592]|nr:unnamed protein product [Symbiodinium sp. CCMP2592]
MTDRTRKREKTAAADDGNPVDASAKKKAKTDDAVPMQLVAETSPMGAHKATPSADADASPAAVAGSWSPPANETDSAVPCLRKLVPHTRARAMEWLQDNMKTHVGAAANIENVPPLRIQPPSGQKKLSNAAGYKEIWDLKNMMNSLNNSGVYEAGSTIWILSVPLDDEVEDSWSNYVQLGSEVFARSNKTGLVVLGLSIPACLDAVPTTTLPTFVKAIGAQKMCMAFYVMLALAFREKDEQRVKELMLLSLGVTVSFFVNLNETERIVEQTRANFQAKSLGKSCADSWLTWSLRAIRVAELHSVKLSGSDKSATALGDLGLKMDGKSVSRNHTQCLGLQQAMLTEDSIALLRTTERLFKEKPLTQDYTKLLRILKVVQNASAHHRASYDMVETANWVISACLVELLRGSVEPSFFTVSALDPLHKPGFVALLITRHRLINYLSCVVSVLDDAASKTEMQAVLQHFLTPIAFNEKFPVRSSAAESGGSTGQDPSDDKQEEVAEEGSSPLQDLQASLKHMCSKKLATLLHDCMDGAYDEGLVEVATNSKFEEVVTDPAQMEKSDKGDKKTLANLVVAVRGFQAMLENARAGTRNSCSDTSVPSLSLRTLARLSSDPELPSVQLEERKEVWSKAQACRRKLCHVAQATTLAEIMAAVERFKENVVKPRTSLKLNEAHMLVILSLDCVQEPTTTPWRPTKAGVDKKLVEAPMQYLKTLNKSFEIGFVFDGRNKGHREAVAADCQDLSEGMVLYLPRERRERGASTTEDRSRTVPFSDMLHEAFYVRFGCGNRSKVALAKKDDPNAGSLYLNVPRATALPRVAQSAKRSALGVGVEVAMAPKSYEEEAIPWFWLEGKPMTFWKQFVQGWSAGFVVDLRMTTQLPLACLSAAIPYLGFASSSKHAAFMSNVLDLAALEHICKNGHYLYSQELASAVKDLYSDELETPINQDIAVESDGEAGES